MGFQAVVNTDPAIGIPGQEVNPHQAVYTAFNYVSDGTLQAGGFAFAVAITGDTPTEQNVASSKASAGAKVLGFVERDQVVSIPNVADEATAIYPEGTTPPIAIRGQFYAKATGSVTEGQSVLCDPTSGAITYGTAGSTNDTGWIVVFPRGVKTVGNGDLVIYQNFGVSVSATAGG